MLGIKILIFDVGKKKINVYGKMRILVVGVEKNWIYDDLRIGY